MDDLDDFQIIPMQKEKSIIKETIEVPAGLAMTKGGTITNDKVNNDDNSDEEW